MDWDLHSDHFNEFMHHILGWISRGWTQAQLLAFCEQTLLLPDMKWKLSVRCADRGGRLFFLGVLFDLFQSALLHTAILDLTPRWW